LVAQLQRTLHAQPREFAQRVNSVP
jgi:hypothetical protein